MARMGFIQDKLEIKFLLLYIASRLIEPVPFEAMQELAMIDDGVDFFDFSECMNDLVTSGHLTLSEDGLYAITEKGLRVVRETTQTFDRFDQSMFEGVSEEEMHRFIQFAEKLQSNLQACKAEGEKNRS